MKIKHLFFDLDHTLWDFEKNAKICLSAIFDNHRNEIPLNINFEEFYSIFSKVNQNLWEKLETGEITHSQLHEIRFKTVFADFNHEISKELSDALNHQFLENLPKQIHLIEDAILVLKKLSNIYNLHIVSNGFEDIQIKKLENSGILHFFENIITIDNAKARKPDPEIFLFALNLCQANANETIMIGDSFVADIKGAENVGITAIHFDETNTSKHDYSCNNLSMIPEILEVLELIG